MFKSECLCQQIGIRMVNVIELTKPIKISGKHSFLVQLTMFDTDVVDAIKQLPTFYYHKAAGV